MDSESEGDYSEDFDGSSPEASPTPSARERPKVGESPKILSNQVFDDWEDELESTPQLLNDDHRQKKGTLEGRERKALVRKKVDSSHKTAASTSKVSIHTPTARTSHGGSTHLKKTINDTARVTRKGATKGVSATPAQYTLTVPVPSKIQSTTSKASSSKYGVLKTSPRDREMSACNNQIGNLSSRVTYLRKQMEEMKKENRLLKRIQVRQEKELQNLHGDDGELPRMIHRHNEEVRFYTEKLKQLREANNLLTRKLHSSEQSASILLEKNSKLKRITEDKSLLERDQLTLNLDITRENLRKASARVKDLERANEMLLKKHAAEYRLMVKKKKVLSDQVNEIGQVNEALLKRLKEREKELEILNIYTQKFGRTFPKAQSSVYASKDTQTEVSLSSNKEIFLIPPSLSTTSTQTAHVKVDSSSTQTEAIAPMKSDTVFMSTHASGSAAASTPPPSQEQSQEPSQKPSQEPSQKPSQEPSYHVKPVVEEVVQKEQLPTLPAQPAAVTSLKLSAVPPSIPPPADKTKQNHVLAGSGTAQLKNEEELRKKLLLSKLLNMGTGSQVTPPVIESVKDSLSATPATTTDMYLYRSQPTVQSNATSTSTTTHFSLQPGTLSVLASTPASLSATAPSKPLTDISYAGTTTSTAAAVPFSMTQPLQSAMAPSIPFSTARSIPQTIATSSIASLLRTQPTSVLASTTPYEPTGLTTYSKGNSFAFGSTFTSVSTGASKFSTASPVQIPSTSLQSMTGSSQQSGALTATTQLGMSKRTIEDDKKKELLAKLTAMDNYEGPQENRLRTDSKSSSSSSSHVWPNTVENLHQGKHAYATEKDPYGSRVFGTDSRRGQNSEGTGYSDKFNLSFGSGRRAKAESKTSILDGTNLKRNTSEYSWENKVDVQGGNKGGGGIFADIMGQTGSLSSEKTGQSGARAGVNSVIRTGQIRTSNTSSLNLN